MNEETFYLTGTDEHGDKIVQAAEENRENPQEYVDRISSTFRELWSKLGVEYDYFIRTTDLDHIKRVQRFLQIVYDKGDIHFGEYGGYYCFGCECFYTEKELVNGLCPTHQKAPQYIKEKNYFFSISKYQQWLKDYINDNPEFIQPWQFRNEVLAMLREPMDDLCISRPKTRLTWGVELPFDQEYVTYVWFDALINYISALGWPESENFSKFWPRSFHLIAKDILKPHAIFWPIMLKSAGLNPYQGLRIHGYWMVKEAKMSKSLGNVVEPLDIIDKYGLDPFRYFLLREMHLGHDSSFSESALVNRFNADLANDLGNLFNRSLSMIHKYFHGQVPEQDSLTEFDKELMSLGSSSLSQYMEYFNQFQIAQALEALWEFVRGINKYIDSTSPWSLFKAGDKKRLSTVISVVWGGLRKIALALWPVMPRTSEIMFDQLGLELNLSEIDLKDETNKWLGWGKGIKVAKKSNLFPRQVLQQPQDLSKKENKKNDLKKEKVKEIDFSDFQKLDLRIGEVIEAEYLPDTNNLLRVMVNLGEDKTRQIVAGLAEYIDPKELINQQVVVVANLKPRKLKGVVSEGMILAVHGKSNIQLLEPLQKVKPGSKVS